MHFQRLDTLVGITLKAREVLAKSVEITNDSHVSLLIRQDEHIVFPIDPIIGYGAPVIRIQAFLIFERDSMSSKQPDLLEHILLFDFIFLALTGG